MSEEFELITVNSGYISGRDNDGTPDEAQEDVWEEQFNEFIANRTGHRESPIPEIDMFENNDDAYVPVPTMNERGKEAPLPDIDMDWSSMGSDA